jgi:xanthine dehydrogenase accessory factor
MSVRQQNVVRPGCSVHSAGGEWLAPLAGHWTEAALSRLSRQAQLVRVTVVVLRGSAPREPGASMLVDREATVGTIGGGQLEWRATVLAREQLDDPRTAPVRLVDLVLGPDLGQCCGGRVELWLERLTRDDTRWLTEATHRLRADRTTSIATDLKQGAVTHRLLPALPGTHRLRLMRGAGADLRLLETLHRTRPPLFIFGAGHVGQALVRLLADLAMFEITWIDPRAELLPGGLPAQVSAVVCDAPARLAPAAPPGTRFVVMTHDHALDYQLCRAILQREDAFWLGLIGSASKSARFRSRLLREGLPAAIVSRLRCPIGVPGITSKLPAAIAIAVAAQLLQSGAAGAGSAGDAEACGAAGACGSASACSACGEPR